MSQNKPLGHLGIIMDGNRRWAKNQGLPALEGHRRGYDKLKKAASWCIKKNIKILTVYAFSTENWNRSEKEVSYLMNLLRTGLLRDIKELGEKGVKVKFIGQISRLDKDLQRLIKDVEAQTRANKKLLFQVAISYGGRPELIFAVQKIVRQKIRPEKITEKVIAAHLWTAGVADPDLIVRTSGEQRLSNFLTWQSAYSELMFIEKHWPDFNESDLNKIVVEYNKRQRRFGV